MTDMEPTQGSNEALDTAQGLLEQGLVHHGAGQFEKALAAFDEAASLAADHPLEQKSLAQMAAIAWYQMRDMDRTLGILTRMQVKTLEKSEVRIILDRLSLKVMESFAALIRQGSLREGFIQLKILASVLPPSHPRRDDLLEFFDRELTSQRVAAIRDRLGLASRNLTAVSTHLVRLAIQPDSTTEPGLENVECRLRLYALTEEREILLDLEAETLDQERRLLTAHDSGALELYQQKVQDEPVLSRLLDLARCLCLEKMHYRTTYRFEAKDRIFGRLPEVLGKFVVHPVYRKVHRLETALHDERVAYRQGLTRDVDAALASDAHRNSADGGVD